MDLFFASLYKYKILSLWEETSIVKMHSHLVLWMVHGEWSWTKRWDENNIDESFCQAVAASSCFIGFVREVVPHDMFLWWHGEKCGIAHRSTWEKNDDVTVTSNAFETFETDLPKFSISKILSHNSSPETFAIWGGGGLLNKILFRVTQPCHHLAYCFQWHHATVHLQNLLLHWSPSPQS